MGFSIRRKQEEKNAYRACANNDNQIRFVTVPIETNIAIFNVMQSRSMAMPMPTTQNYKWKWKKKWVNDRKSIEKIKTQLITFTKNKTKVSRSTKSLQTIYQPTETEKWKQNKTQNQANGKQATQWFYQ